MASVEMKEVLFCPVEKVWDIVCDLHDSHWRSDIKNIEILEENKRFIEYTKDGFATYFTICVFEPFKHYAFTMENQNMQGQWHGYFVGIGEKTEITFVEHVEVKKMIMKPFVKGYLKKQQKQYIEDLKKTLQL